MEKRLLGRYSSDRDDEVGAPAAVMLSHALWQTDFGGDASVVGKSVILDDKAYTAASRRDRSSTAGAEVFFEKTWHCGTLFVPIPPKPLSG